ncbi:MAG: hypothetical protein MJ245_07340 [Clostridia bacterium]|nr:hypothetical protein [Clostridia bacterium]
MNIMQHGMLVDLAFSKRIMILVPRDNETRTDTKIGIDMEQKITDGKYIICKCQKAFTQGDGMIRVVIESIKTKDLLYGYILNNGQIIVDNSNITYVPIQADKVMFFFNDKSREMHNAVYDMQEEAKLYSDRAEEIYNYLDTEYV